MKKVIVIVIIIVSVTFLSGCSSEELVLSTYVSDDTYSTYQNESEFLGSNKYKIYHDDNYIYKLEILYEYKLVNGSMADLNEYIINCEVDPYEKYNIKGYESICQIENDIFIDSLIFDYNIMDIEAIMKNDEEYGGFSTFWLEKYIDDDFNVPYDKMKRMFEENGYYCVEDN